MHRLISGVAAVAFVAAALVLGATAPAVAAVIASDDFESYTVGDILGQGAIGSGWASAYSGLNCTKASSTALRNVAANVMPGFGQSLEVGFSVVSGAPQNHNVVQRTFDNQTGDVYVGFAIKTVGFDVGGVGDFVQLFFNNTVDTSATSSSKDNSLSIGTDFSPPPDGDNGAYFARKGGDQTPTTFVHSNDVVHRMVMKVSKSSPGFPDIYDQVAVFVDQATEGAPDATRGASEVTTPDFMTLSQLHLRLYGLELEDRVYMDGLRIATTYAEALPDLPVVPSIPGDTDGNKVVDAVDAAVVATNWGANVGTGGFASGDFNADQLVNAADASIQAANWGSHAGEASAAVPEPGAIALVLGLALAALVRRSR
jgi:hypothetical protein